ncbi:MAG: hypothetical protein ACOX19_05565 [Fermentimonas sp.]|jgi:hypothetical protein
MKPKGNTLNETRLEQIPTNKPVELYSAPQIEVIEIELTQNILQPSNGEGTFDLPEYQDGGDAW